MLVHPSARVVIPSEGELGWSNKNESLTRWFVQAGSRLVHRDASSVISSNRVSGGIYVYVYVCKEEMMVRRRIC